MSNIKVGDFVWHPMSIDIIKHKVTSIRQFEGFNHYVLKAEQAVGACGRLEVIVDEHKGKLRFVELLYEDEMPYAKGLQDFVEGDYYTDLNKAKLAYYTRIEYEYKKSVDACKNRHDQAVRDYEKVKLLVTEIENLMKG